MFVRFRQSPQRLQLSLVDTRREGGRVRHEHIASLGSVAAPPSLADRVAYWEQLHERIGRLSNRLGSETQAKILAAVHARIAIPSLDERRSLQLENAAADERLWSTLQDMNQDLVEGHKAVIATAERAIADGQAGATQAAERAATAREQIARLKAGEDVVGVSTRRMTWKEILAATGFSPRQARRALRMGALSEEQFEEFLQEYGDRFTRADDRIADAVLRAVYRRHSPEGQGGQP